MIKPHLKKQSASPIRMPKGSVKPIRRKPTKGISIFKKKPSKSHRAKRKTEINSKFFLIPLLLILFGGLVYISIKYVLSLRSNAFGSKSYVVNDVTGLSNVPEYPGSHFTYTNNKYEITVKEFLAAGNSTYRLPEGTDVEDIENYYKEELPKRGWELVNTVVIGTEDRKYGQYWVKEGKGLRIYMKFKDIWYETISEANARTALASKVQEEIEREMLMASSEKQDLLPDYPWKIQIPKEYLIRYEATDFKDFTAISFQRIGTSDIVKLYPVGYSNSKELDFILEDYCNIVSTEEETWKVQNTVPSIFDSLSSLNGTIVSEGNMVSVSVIQNKTNGVAYVLSSTKENNPLVGYILDNMKAIDIR